MEPARPRWVLGHPRSWHLAVGTVCVGAFMGQLDASIVTVAVPSLQRAFHASVATTTWVGLSYVVALVGFVAPAGRFADLHGRKLTYLYGLVVFGAASLLCAVSPNLAVLASLRAVQGLGAAMLQANSVAIIATTAPRNRLASALGAQGAAQALGLAAGPTVGGALLALAGWRWLFLVNVPAAALALGLGWLLLPRSEVAAAAGRIDAAGVGLLAATVGAALCAASLGGRHDLGPVAAGAFSATAAVLAALFVRNERRARRPLFRVDVVATRAVSFRLLASTCCYVAMFAALLATPFLLEAHLHQSLSTAGLVVAVLPCAVGFAAALAPRLEFLEGGAVGGPLVAAAGLVGLAVLHGSPVLVALDLGVTGAGIGAFLPANTSALLEGAASEMAGELGGLVNLARGLGTGLGLGVGGMVLDALGGSRGIEAVAVGAAGLALAAAALTAGSSARHVVPDPTGGFAPRR